MFHPTEKYAERNSPHIRRRRTASMCMWHVMIALAPATITAFYYFGLPALCVVATAMCGCIATEWLIGRYMLRANSPASLAASLLTGLLLALNLPPSTPLWAVLLGCVAAIGIGKMAFGGLGCNIFNPALVGRVFLLISFPAAMTTWALPGAMFEADATTGPTLLTAISQGNATQSIHALSDLLAGNRAGSLGETAAGALLLGFAYLLIMRVIKWQIPVSILATVAIFDIAIGIPAGLDLLAGGLLLGAIYMATDYVTSPMTSRGMIIFGIGIGIITVVIRRWGAYPEGMSFAILIMNGVVPLLNRYCRPRLFGSKQERRAAA